MSLIAIPDTAVWARDLFARDPRVMEDAIEEAREAREEAAYSDEVEDAKMDAVRLALDLCEEARRARRPLPTLDEVLGLLD